MKLPDYKRFLGAAGSAVQQQKVLAGAMLLAIILVGFLITRVKLPSVNGTPTPAPNLPNITGQLGDEPTAPPAEFLPQSVLPKGLWIHSFQGLGQPAQLGLYPCAESTEEVNNLLNEYISFVVRNYPTVKEGQNIQRVLAASEVNDVFSIQQEDAYFSVSLKSRYTMEELLKRYQPNISLSSLAAADLTTVWESQPRFVCSKRYVEYLNTAYKSGGSYLHPFAIANTALDVKSQYRILAASYIDNPATGMGKVTAAFSPNEESVKMLLDYFYAIQFLPTQGSSVIKREVRHESGAWTVKDTVEPVCGKANCAKTTKFYIMTLNEQTGVINIQTK